MIDNQGKELEMQEVVKEVYEDKMEESHKQSAYTFAKNQVKSLDVLEFTEDRIKDLSKKVKQVIMSKRNGTHYILMSPYFSYLTVFNRSEGATDTHAAKHIVDFIVSEKESLGDLQDYALRQEGAIMPYLEIWMGGEMYMLSNYDAGTEVIESE